jgi:hypothetical protein
MSVDKFRFVSPGIFTAEIDDSRLPAIPAAIGPVVIGRTAQGPAMRPVRVSSIQELERVFGAPSNGKGAGTGDVWREGGQLAPTYATYAAKAFLRNSNPVTVVRTIGTQHPNATTSLGKAGWEVVKADGATVAAEAGAYGLFVTAVSGTSLSPATASLAAVFYLTGAVPGLIGSAVNAAYTATDSKPLINAFVKSSTAGVFTLKVSGSTSETIDISLDPVNSKFIRKSLNTDPTRLNPTVTVSTNAKSYFLGESFEGSVKDKLGSVSSTLAGIIIKLPEHSSRKQDNSNASTGWVVSQHNGPSSSFVANGNGEYPVNKLFRFKTLGGGDWEQSNIKVSIENIRASTNPEIPWATFDVVVRDLLETAASNARERFQGVDLDPASPNYIARVVGDLYTTWDYNEERYKEYGLYRNNSANIRVEVSDYVSNGNALGDLPFGFYGPPTYVSKLYTKQQTTAISSYIVPSSVTSMITSSVSGDTGSLVIGADNAAVTIAFPSPTLKTSNGSTSLSRFRFGLKADKPANSDLKDILSAPNSTVAGLLSGEGLYVPDGSKTTYSSFFSLDDVQVTGSNNQIANWGIGFRAAGSGSISGSAVVLEYINDFDMPLFGGFNGNNILEKEAIINNRLLGSTQSALGNAAFNTLDVAIKSVSDPEVVEMNLLTVPGVQVAAITDKVLDVCQTRGDALGIIDLVGDYKPAYDAGTTETRASVTTAVNGLKDRLLNTSYACAYFPAVFSPTEGIFLPSSVAALGVMGGTENNAALWFAPAGFNRGGLNVGNSGIAVSRTAQALTARERDSLYQSNINPIATFPAEGVVIFGQKTLQVTPSALDRINVRRLMIYVKKQISRYATQVLFDPNVEVTWKRFTSLVNPFLASVKSGYGLSDFRVQLDESTTTPDLVDRNVMYAKILLKPTRAIEFIALDFVIKNTGASFDD